MFKFQIIQNTSLILPQDNPMKQPKTLWEFRPEEAFFKVH